MDISWMEPESKKLPPVHAGRTWGKGHTPGVIWADYCSCSSVETKSCCPQCVRRDAITNNIWDQLQLRVFCKIFSNFISYLCIYLCMAHPQGSKNFFHSKGNIYKPHVRLTCRFLVSVVDTEKMVSTTVKLIYLVFLFSFLFFCTENQYSLMPLAKWHYWLKIPCGFWMICWWPSKLRERKKMMIKTSKWPFFHPRGHW